jgi:hypothetical protein
MVVISSCRYVASGDIMTVNNALDRTRKQAVVLYSEVLSRNLPGRAKEHHKISQLIYLLSG